MKSPNVLKFVCDAISTHEGVMVDDAGKGIVDYNGHLIRFKIQYFENKHTFSIDFIFGIEISFNVVEIELFMCEYNANSTISHLLNSGKPSLRISHCFGEELPASEFILKLFESALVAWEVLEPGFERIDQEGLIFDPNASRNVDPSEFYEEIVGEKLNRHGLLL